MRRSRLRPTRPTRRALVLCCTAVALMMAALTVRGCMMAKRAAQTNVRTIQVYEREAGRLTAMPLEEYVLLCTAAEMPASFESQALCAQAVAARTYAVRRLMGYTESCGAGDVCTQSSCCQAYSSYAKLKADWGADYDKNLKKLKAAVEKTAGVIAVYGGEPIEALYHSCSGGRTEDAANVFAGGAPYLIGVNSPGEEGAKHFSDSVSFSRREFAKAVNRETDAGLEHRKLEEQVEILSRFESGRVESVRLGKVTLTGRELRKALGLYSANFDIVMDAKTVTVNTLGYGHGAGMAQYGANAMAKAGASYEEILLHYYTGIELAGFE